ncbi:MAG: response regulator transcription factor [Anaerolineae bacterium]
MIRLMIVDDQAAVRQGLHMLFATTPDMSVVGEASGGQAALDLADLLCPDVVLMDVEMPGMDGIATARAFHRIRPQAGIIVLSIHDDERTRALAQTAGAAAFVAKSTPPDTLLAAIWRVALH